MTLEGVRTVRVTTGDLGGLFLVVTSETKTRGADEGVECHRTKVGDERKQGHTGSWTLFPPWTPCGTTAGGDEQPPHKEPRGEAATAPHSRDIFSAPGQQ